MSVNTDSKLLIFCFSFINSDNKMVSQMPLIYLSSIAYDHYITSES